MRGRSGKNVILWLIIDSVLWFGGLLLLLLTTGSLMSLGIVMMLTALSFRITNLSEDLTWTTRQFLDR